MKEHNIDQLFRQKLHQHGVTPSPAAWEQVAKGVQTNRRKKGVYYVAAAAIALFVLAGWFGLQLQQNRLPLDTSAPMAVHQQPKQLPDPLAKGPDAADQASTAAENTPEAVISSETSTVEAVQSTESALALTETVPNSIKRHTPAPAKIADEQIKSSLPLVPQTTAELPTQTSIAQALPELDKVEANISMPDKQPATLVEPVVLAKAEQVVIRYDGNNLANAEEEENTSEKVLSVLQKVKQGEVGLASIRQAKNNFLSGKFNKP